eukprot:TRINITY_DN751_c2_g1_i1.p1 TRINITY_DN751_c2_g1~~TRINITY_DN751_c2_g1_i1.p1  ORF type:complete len:497 (+),score=92.49 TRINITY_DN751_c2_g1_i1:91-1491(+)
MAAEQPTACETHPGARSGHTLTPVGHEYLALFGGLVNKGKDAETCSSDLYLLSVDSLQWRRVHLSGEPPVAVFAHSAAAVGPEDSGALVIYAGMMNGKSNLSDQVTLISDLHGFAPTARRLSCRGKNPGKRWGHSGVRLPGSGEMLVFGGMCDGSSLNDVWLLNCEQMRWKHLECSGDVPAGRRRHTCTEHAGSVYVFGGRDTAGKHFNDLHCLCPDTGVWQKIKYGMGPRPDVRVGHAAAVINDVLVVYGGSSVQPSADSGYMVLNDAFGLPLTADDKRWVKVETDWGAPRRTMATSFASGSSMYVVFGRDNRSSSASLFSVPLPAGLVRAKRSAQPKPQPAPPPPPVVKAPKPRLKVSSHQQTPLLVKTPAPAPRSSVPAAAQQPAAAIRGGLPQPPVLQQRDHNVPQIDKSTRPPKHVQMQMCAAAQQQHSAEADDPESPFSKFCRSRLNLSPPAGTGVELFP